MEKKLSLIKVENNYKIIGEDVSIDIVGNKLNTEDIYTKIYSCLSDDDKEVNISIDTELAEKSDTIILNQLKDLFKSIDNSINEQIKEK